MLWVCYAGGWWLLGAAVLLALIALREWRRALMLTSLRPDYVLAAFFILAFLICTYFLYGPRLDSLLLFLVVFAAGLAFISRILSPGGPSAVCDIGVTFLTPAYLGLFLSYLLRIRLEPWGAPVHTLDGIFIFPEFYFLVILFLTCWAMDTGAYLCGRFIGGPKLCPSISPGKTIIGLIGAIVTAAAVAAAGFALVGLPASFGLLLGALLGVVGQLGDLAKSLVKREVGIKDFGLIFPAHGGILDRFDNVLFNAPLLFYFLMWLLQGGL